MPKYDYSVFVNCPFDDEYEKLFNALIFVIQDSGFISRCSREIIDASQIRIDKITQIISECKYGIHDISRTELDKKNNLPRFNMPLELGLFIGAKRFGSRQHKNKKCLILDKIAYRYQKFCSDISGQDIEIHNRKPKNAIRITRDWLQSNNPDKKVTIPSGSVIYDRYSIFQKELPLICKGIHLNKNELIFNDYVQVVNTWLRRNELG